MGKASGPSLLAMKEAQDLLVEFGEAFLFYAEFQEEDYRGCFRKSARKLLELLTRGPVTDGDVGALLPRKERFGEFVGVLASSSAEGLSAPEGLDAVLALLVEFGTAYFWASKSGTDVPEDANLQTSTRVLLEMLTGRPPLPEHVEDVFPYEDVLSDA